MNPVPHKLVIIADLFQMFVCLLFFFSGLFLSTSFFSHPFFPFLPFSTVLEPEGKGLQVRQPPLRLSVADIENINLE